MKNISLVSIITLCLLLSLQTSRAYAQHGNKAKNENEGYSEEEDLNDPGAAQADKITSYKKGTVDIDFGAGFVSQVDDGIHDLTKRTTIPLSFVTADFAVSNCVSLGVYTGFTKVDITGGGNDLANITHFITGVRALYHFETHTRFDPYMGGMLAYNTSSINMKITDAGTQSLLTTNPYLYTLIAGARFRLSDQFGAFVELGYGITLVNFGLNLRLVKQYHRKLMRTKNAWE